MRWLYVIRLGSLLALVVFFAGPAVSAFAYNLTWLSISKTIMAQTYQNDEEHWSYSLGEYPLSKGALILKQSPTMTSGWLDWQRNEKLSNPRWQYLAGYILMLQKDFNSARDSFQEYAIGSADRTGLSYFFWGFAYEWNSQPEQAVETWKLAPETAEHFLRIGSDYFYNRENPRQALEYFSVASQIAPEMCEPRYRLASAQLELGKPEQALDTLLRLETFLCMDTEFLGEMYYLKGKILASRQQLEEAITNLRQAVLLNPLDTKRLVLLGIQLSRSGDQVQMVEAHALLTQAVALDEDAMWAYVGLCDLERRQQHFSQALEWCQQAELRFPDSMEPVFYSGRVYFDMQNFSEAATRFEKATTLAPSNINTWLRLAQAYEGTGYLEQAIDAYQFALQLEPDNESVKRRIQELSK